jgi:hypothetical protein
MITTPTGKFQIAALLLVFTLLGGFLKVLDAATVRTLSVGVAAWAVGYGMNGFGKINTGLQNVQDTVAQTVRDEMAPFVARLCAAEDRLGLSPQGSVTTITTSQAVPQAATAQDAL